MAQKIAAEEDDISRKQNQRSWIARQAEAAGLDMDDADLDDGEGGASEHGKRYARRTNEDMDDYADRLRKMKKQDEKIMTLRTQLQELLKRPITSRG